MFKTCLVGQSRVVGRLEMLLQKARIPQALLFLGPDGTGKTAAAFAFARALHCEASEAKPCDICRGCRKTATLNHADFSVLFPFTARVREASERTALQTVLEAPYTYALPEDTATIPIDQIRDIQKRFAYGTYESPWRTAVLLHADKMRPEAANALLKTLEEPPEQSLLLLTSSHPEALLPTIVSRCQFVKFPPLGPQDIAQALSERNQLEEDRATFIARTCGGSLRRAQELASADIEDLQNRAYRFLDALIWGVESKTYAALEQLASDRQEAFLLLRGAEVWLRDVLLHQQDNADRISNAGQMAHIQRLSEAFDLERLHETARKIESLREMNFRNVNIHMGLISLWRQMRRYAQPALSGR